MNPVCTLLGLAQFATNRSQTSSRPSFAPTGMTMQIEASPWRSDKAREKKERKKGQKSNVNEKTRKEMEDRERDTHRDTEEPETQKLIEKTSGSGTETMMRVVCTIERTRRDEKYINENGKRRGGVWNVPELHPCTALLAI